MRIKDKTIYLWFIPPITFVVIIYLLPLWRIIYSCFTRTIAGQTLFVGWDNFIGVADELPRLISTTMIWTIGSILPAMLLGFTAALVFQRDFRGKKLMMSCTVLPYTIPLVIVASVWMMMYQPNFGLLNVLLVKLGIFNKGISFLSYDKALTSVIVARVWRAMPYAFISYYAAIRSIPLEYYEAAAVDGANAVQKLFFITIPQVASVTLTTLIISTVWTFLVFDIIYTMTGGGPVDATNIIAVQIYKYSILKNDTESAAVLSLVSILILLAITEIYWKIFNRGGETK